MIVILATGVLIGLAVGMVGAGGAVLAVPALVYGAGLEVHEATTVSLAVVAGAAAVGAIGQARRATVCWSSAAWFAAGAACGSVAGTIANTAMASSALLAAFAVVMLLAALAMWRRAGEPSTQRGPGCPHARIQVLVPLGAMVGALTGLVGVGGGFVVVPALAIGLSFGMREAMGTSMVIIALASTCALAGHLVAGGDFEPAVATTMGAAAIAGAVAGPRMAAQIPERSLGRGFAALVAAVSVGVMTAALTGA